MSSVFDALDLREPIRTTTQDLRDEELRKRKLREDYTYGEAVSDSVQQGWRTTLSILDWRDTPQADPDWDFTAEHMDTVQKELPEFLWERVAEAQSQEQFDYFMSKAREEQGRLDRMSTSSGFGTAGQMAVGIIDPVELVASVAADAATGGMATPAVLARYANKLRGGARTLSTVEKSTRFGAANAAVGGTASALQGNSAQEVLQDAGTDFVAGAVLGTIPSAFAAYGNKLRNSAGPQVGDAEAFASTHAQQDAFRGSVGAATSPRDPNKLGDTITTNADFDVADLPKPSLEGAQRLNPTASVGSRGATSVNAAERLVMAELAPNPVGFEDNVVVKSNAAERQSLYYNGITAPFRLSINSNIRSWAKDNGFKNWFNIPGTNARQQFGRDVGRYIRDRTPNRDELYHPSVVAQAKTEIAAYRKQLQAMKDGGIPGTEHLEVSDFYSPMVVDATNTNTILSKFDYPTLRRFMAGAFRDMLTRENRQIDEDLLTLASEKYLQKITSVGMGHVDDLADALGRRSKQALRDALESLDLTPEQSDRLVNALGSDGPAAFSNLKARTGLDYDFSADIRAKDGTSARLTLADFFADDREAIFGSYMNKATGWQALSEVKIINPVDGRIMIDGIKSKTDMQKAILMVQDWARDNRVGTGSVGMGFSGTSVERIQYMFDKLTGKPIKSSAGEASTWLRRVADYNVLRLMNNLGFNSALEFANLVSATSVRAAWKQMPALREIAKMKDDKVLMNSTARDLYLFGLIDPETIPGVIRHNLDEELGETGIGTLARKYDDTVRTAKIVQAHASLHASVFKRAQIGSVMVSLQWFADLAHDAKKMSKFKSRLADLGMIPERLQLAIGQLKKHSSNWDPDRRTVTDLNLEKWDDTELRAEFVTAVNRYAHRLVIRGEKGDLPLFMDGPISRVLLQFMPFSMRSTEKGTLWSIKHRDRIALKMFVGQLGFAAAVYALQVNIRAATMGNKAEEYRAKNLSPDALAKAAIARTSLSGTLPMYSDLLLGRTPIGAQFSSSRSSGLSRDPIQGNPTFEFNDLLKKALIDGLRGEPSTKDLVRLAPGGNHILSTSFIQAMGED